MQASPGAPRQNCPHTANTLEQLDRQQLPPSLTFRALSAILLSLCSCAEFDPWKGAEYDECEFDSRVRSGKLDTSGLGDVKVR